MSEEKVVKVKKETYWAAQAKKLSKPQWRSKNWLLKKDENHSVSVKLEECLDWKENEDPV